MSNPTWDTDPAGGSSAAASAATMAPRAGKTGTVRSAWGEEQTVPAVAALSWRIALPLSQGGLSPPLDCYEESGFLELNAAGNMVNTTLPAGPLPGQESKGV